MAEAKDLAGETVDRTQAAQDLLDDVQQLSEQIVDQVWETLPGYAPPRMRRRELAEAVAPNVTAILHRVLDPQLDDELDLERARELGRTRALQGLALDVVLASFRTAERVLADAWLTAAIEVDLDDTREAMTLIGNEIDRLSGASIEAYRLVAQQITSHYEGLAAGLVTRLVQGDVEPDEVRALAQPLKLDWQDGVQAIALRYDAVNPRLATIVRFQRAALSAVTTDRKGRTLVGRVRGTDLFIISGQIETEQLNLLRRGIETFQELQVQVALGSQVGSLAEAGRSCRQAMLALDVSPSSSDITHIDQVLLEVSAVQSPDLQDRLDALVGEPLMGHQDLCETALVYLEANMSSKDTAAQLTVHPNTVAYRLGRIHEITSFDPRDPKDLVLLALGIRATTSPSQRHEPSVTADEVVSNGAPRGKKSPG